ncbi:MarR family winged helix-turn-helix transcriptional regulator [Nonomuraea terrae]|nr:MarR family winged helix-turn-helix transcriptional regulator [Nonomuraea terrae]
MSTVTPEHLRPLTPDEESFMRALARALITLPRAIDQEMVRQHQLPLIEYQTLMHLSEAPSRRLRMSALAETVDMSLSGMTRIVTRLEGQGLVQRIKCPDDGRGWNAVLTDAGLARLEEAWPAHLTAVRRRLFDHLQGLDLRECTRLLERVNASCAPR